MGIDLQGRLWAGEYEVKEQLAQGGMATVYLAFARSLNTTVAIKVLSPRLAQDPTFRERYRGEATNIAALHHPNIIEVHHFGDEGGTCYIAMRYVAGGSLKERVQAMGGVMDLRSAARLTAQVASALQYAHERGLVHLDVKPGNVLLGSADWPLLSDFGIIKIAGDIRPEGQRIAGTPAYMSPEQWQGRDLDGRSDQYSLGLMFYELVTGRRPFSGETSAELKAKHLTEEPPRPRELNPGIPGPVEEVMLRSLAKDPDQRFPTIGDFGSALVEAVERSRGMQLETKQAVVGAMPNLVALLVLSIFAPILAGLPDPDVYVYRQLTLNWPILLLLALVQAGLLLGVRWHIIGLVTKLLSSIVDGIDRLTRSYVRIGTDAGGPLRVKAWRNAAVGSGEGIVNLAYTFIIYGLIGPSLIQTIALSIESGSRLVPLVATAIAALVFLIAAALIIKIYRVSGAIVAVVVLAVGSGFIVSMQLVDQQIQVMNGQLSLQWLVKLGIGLGVLAAFLGVRRRVQGLAREFLVPALGQGIGKVQRSQDEAAQAARRESLGQAADRLVDVLYLVVGYPVIALATSEVLASLIQVAAASVYEDRARSLTALAITIAVIVFGVVLVNRVRLAAGAIPAVFGLLLLAPTLLGLPLFEETMKGSQAVQWAAQMVIGLGVLILFLGIRKQIQALGRGIIVPVIDQQLGSLLASSSEEQEAQRLLVLQGTSDTLVNVLYLVVGYFAVVGPLASAVAGAVDLAFVTTLIYGLFILLVLFVLYRSVRGVLPALRPGAAAA